jgi:hydrogenase nickel incorporation protein HypA/HybF
MHELAVTQSVLEIALRHAHKAGAGRVTDLYLVIGQLSSIVDDSIAFYWDIISRDTIAEGARLHFERIPAEMVCLDCGRNYSLDGEALSCPECSSTRVKVTAGEDFRLEAIEVEPAAPEVAEPGG